MGLLSRKQRILNRGNSGGWERIIHLNKLVINSASFFKLTGSRAIQAGGGRFR
jgi:hypothetical protein